MFSDKDSPALLLKWSSVLFLIMLLMTNNRFYFGIHLLTNYISIWYFSPRLVDLYSRLARGCRVIFSEF